MTSSSLVRGTRQQIADQMRDDILCGRYAEGDRIGEVELAQRFGVSRGPIREALVQLTHEGLLVARPNCGVKVAPSAPDAVRELIVPIRRTIETYALKVIYDSLTDADWNAWDDLLHGMERACRAKDVSGIVRCDLAFHRSLLERAGQEDSLAIWRTVVARVRSHFRQCVLDYGPKLLGIHAEHRELVDVFRRGDRAAALEALGRHIW